MALELEGRGRERCSQFGLTEVGPAAATESCDCFLLEAFEGTFPLSLELYIEELVSTALIRPRQTHLL